MTPRRALKEANQAIRDGEQLVVKGERLLDVMVIARHFKVSGESVRRWIRSGRLHAERTPGGRYKVAISEAHRGYGVVFDAPPCPRCGVYLVRTGDFIKIGYAANIKQRLLGLSHASPNELTVLRIIECEDLESARRQEAELHKTFADLRHRGEWFRAEPPLIEFASAS